MIYDVRTKLQLFSLTLKTLAIHLQSKNLPLLHFQLFPAGIHDPTKIVLKIMATTLTVKHQSSIVPAQVNWPTLQ